MAHGRYTPFTPTAYAGMDIRFWLRRGKRPGLVGTVYCTLTTAGVAATPFTTGIPAWPPSKPGQRPTPRQWQPGKIQRLFGDAPDVRADNDTLTSLYAALRAVHQQLKDAGQPCTAPDVAHALKRTGQPIPTLAEAAARFLSACEAKRRPDTAPAWDKTGYADSTLKKMASRLGLLTEYLKLQQHPKMPLSKFTAKHADGLARLLTTRQAAPGKVAGRKRGKCGVAYAGKVVGLVSQVLDYAVNQEWLAVNPLASYTAPAGFDKPLVYLVPEQVAQLEAHGFASEYLQRVADMFLFSCWTGLAWAEMDAFDAGAHTAGGWLTMLRQKTGVGFTLPLLPGAHRLLSKYATVPGGLPRYENSPANRCLKEIAAVLGWELELTHHVGRRTFGMFLLNEDVPLATVAAVLGHKNEKTTAKYYCTFIERRKVERDFAALSARLYSQP